MEGDEPTITDIHQISLHQQESNRISVQMDQAAEQSSLKEQVDNMGTKADGGGVDLGGEVVESCRETTVSVAEPESSNQHPKHDISKSGGEITAENGSNAPPPLVSSPTVEDGAESCTTTSEEQLSIREDSMEASERNQHDVSTGDAKETREEADAAAPVRKKKRMGMCGLTEKERSHFLQAGKRENRGERAERQTCRSKDELESPPVLPPSPVRSREAKGETRSHGQMPPSSVVEAGITTTASDDPDCSGGQTGEAEAGRASGLGKSSDPAHEQEEQRLGTEEAVSSCVSPSRDEELLVDHGAAVTNERSEGTSGEAGGGGGAEVGASPPGLQQGVCDGASVELCEAAAPPSGPDEKAIGRPDYRKSESSPSTPNAEQLKIVDPAADPFGPGRTGYVMDSQLDSLCWTDDEATEGDRTPGCSACHEDATDLMSGLIRELSSLNRTVMAMHRELENLRRGSKSLRNSVH